MLDIKGYYPKVYIHSKARNVLVDEDGEWKTTGMGFTRSETPIYFGEIEKQLIQKRLDEEPIDEIREWFKDVCTNKIKEVDSIELGNIKPLNKAIYDYGKWENEKLKGEHTVEEYLEYIDKGIWKGVPEHIKAYLYAWYDYGFQVSIGEKFEIILVKNIPRLNRSDYIAYSMDEGLPEKYEIDYENHLIRKFFNVVDFLLEFEGDEIVDYVFPEHNKKLMRKKKGIEKVTDITRY